MNELFWTVLIPNLFAIQIPTVLSFSFLNFFSSQSKQQSQDDNSSRIVEISDEEADRILAEEKEKSQIKEEKSNIKDEKEKSKEVPKPDEKADEDESEEDKGKRTVTI